MRAILFTLLLLCTATFADALFGLQTGDRVLFLGYGIAASL